MNLLISPSNFAQYRQLSASIDASARLEPYIRQAQELDLLPLLGNALFTHIVNNPTTPENTALLDGGPYTHNSQHLTHFGLRAALVFFAYARFIEAQNISITRFGVVYKANTDVSERIDTATLQHLISQTREQAQAYFNITQQFLEANLGDYPLYKSTNSPQRTNITPVG